VTEFSDLFSPEWFKEAESRVGEIPWSIGECLRPNTADILDDALFQQFVEMVEQERFIESKGTSFYFYYMVRPHGIACAGTNETVSKSFEPLTS
jgi:hypothetical protein